jgi:uncharacterized membrane protein (DUF485 family)
VNRIERIGLDAVMALAALNIWTGAPLLALWVGSRIVETSSSVTMMSVFVIVVVLFAVCLALIYILNAASLAHDRLTGRTQSVRRHVPWLRSMRAERVNWERDRSEITMVDRIVVIAVVLAFVAFEIWFFFFSPSPIGPGPSKD